MVYLSKKPLVEYVEEYIDKHISEDISIEDLCKEFNLSRRSLYEQMSHYVSGGIATFIRHKKLNYAKHLLQTTDMPIPEIAHASGFTDYNYFLRLFKRNFGISPKKFSMNKCDNGC